MQVQLQQLRDELRARFPERQEVIDGAIAAILCGEHVLLLGPPGTAKSSLVRVLATAFGAILFERHITRTSTPEDLLGPVSLQALEDGRLTHNTTGMLPAAHLALLGNISSASSPVLNLLLPVLDERTFVNDGVPVPIPLLSLFGTTTELPEDGAQESLVDRFLLRFELDYLQRPSSFRDVLTAPEPVATTVLGMEALRAMRADIDNVKVTADTLDALLVLRDALKDEGLVASDRRWKRSLRLSRSPKVLRQIQRGCTGWAHATSTEPSRAGAHRIRQKAAAAGAPPYTGRPPVPAPAGGEAPGGRQRGRRSEPADQSEPAHRLQVVETLPVRPEGDGAG
jgi:MoxR-like ATPase